MYIRKANKSDLDGIEKIYDVSIPQRRAESRL